jgi:hypothetical protein
MYRERNPFPLRVFMDGFHGLHKGFLPPNMMNFLNFRNFVMDKALKKIVCKACIICMEKDDAHWT